VTEICSAQKLEAGKFPVPAPKFFVSLAKVSIATAIAQDLTCGELSGSKAWEVFVVSG
jgi:hypothetical protein